MPGLPRVAVLAGAVGFAAVALFMLPAILGIGGGSSPSARPSTSPAVATAVPSATIKPGPTAQVYVVKKGDTMSKIAARFEVTVEEIMAVNPAITNPNKIALGQEIVIPAASSSAAPVAKPSAIPSASAVP
jgi:LysM repeat protein